MGRRKKPGKFQNKRGQDQAVAQAVAAESTPRTWESARERYSPDVQARVDEMRAKGGLSLADIEAMEYAEHEAMGALIADPGMKDTARAALYSVRLQARKHLRMINGLRNPVGTPDDGKATVPARLAGKYGATAERRAQSAAAGGEAKRDVDGGDDLMSAPRLEA